jgi:ATP-dependent protease Clp ATPase subunit
MTEPVCFMCGAAEDEVDRLFRGIHGWICGECVRECGQLLAGTVKETQ